MLVEASSRLGMLCKYAHTHTSQRCCRRFTWYISAQTSTAIACNTLAKHADTHIHNRTQKRVCQSSPASLFSDINHPGSCRTPMSYCLGAHIHLLAIKSESVFFFMKACFSTKSTTSVSIHQKPSMPCYVRTSGTS